MPLEMIKANLNSKLKDLILQIKERTLQKVESQENVSVRVELEEKIAEIGKT